MISSVAKNLYEKTAMQDYLYNQIFLNNGISYIYMF